MFLWSSATKSSIESLRALENQSETGEGANDGFYQQFHSWSLEEDNKLEGVVGCFVASLQHHISSSWNFMCRWIRILYTGFTLQTFLCSNCNGICLCPNCYNLSLLRRCSSETLEVWPRYFFELIQVFLLNPLWICLCSNRYGVALWDCSYGTLS